MDEKYDLIVINNLAWSPSHHSASVHIGQGHVTTTPNMFGLSHSLIGIMAELWTWSSLTVSFVVFIVKRYLSRMDRFFLGE